MGILYSSEQRLAATADPEEAREPNAHLRTRWHLIVLVVTPLVLAVVDLVDRDWLGAAVFGFLGLSQLTLRILHRHGHLSRRP